MGILKLRIQISIYICILVSACGTPQIDMISTATPVEKSGLTPTSLPTSTPRPTATITPTITPSPSPTLDLAIKEQEFVEEIGDLFDAGDLQSAIDLCSTEINDDKSFAMGYLMRGFTNLALQDYESALIDIDSAIELGIAEDFDKEIEPGVSAKTVFYFRGLVNMLLGSYVRGIEDYEFFLEITEPLEYPEFRANAQSEIANFQLDPESVSSGQRFEFTYYSIAAPESQGWHVKSREYMSINFGRLELLDPGETVYSERTTIGYTSVEFLEIDYTDDEFLEYACWNMTIQGGRYISLDQDCSWCEEPRSGCVCYQGLVEDHGGMDLPYSPPLIMAGQSMTCRHPDLSQVLITLHYSQRSPIGSLEDNINPHAESFFQGLIFNQIEE